MELMKHGVPVGVISGEITVNRLHVDGAAPADKMMACALDTSEAWSELLDSDEEVPALRSHDDTVYLKVFQRNSQVYFSEDENSDGDHTGAAEAMEPLPSGPDAVPQDEEADDDDEDIVKRSSVVQDTAVLPQGLNCIATLFHALQSRAATARPRRAPPRPPRCCTGAARADSVEQAQWRDFV